MRLLIVDDEEPGRVNLRYSLAAHPECAIVAECASAASAREALASLEIDVVFLDIQMPQETGLSLARALSLQTEPPLIIFVTAHSVHAIAAFEVHALDYLLKPVDDARLAQAVQRAAAMLAQRQRRAYGEALRGYVGAAASPYLEQISVRSVGRIDQVSVGNIQWIESAGNYVHLHTAGHSLLHRVALSRLEPHLDPAQFLRVHRRAIVRRAQLATLVVAGDGCYLLTLRCGAQVPVSERHVQLVRTAMQ
ncbi:MULTISPECIES: LytR/AlgR family response regulator transcription factor [unclassified Janthinobacterium]|uniref:LytR/AlgR family response regulator transcription factor n=1 Tax=unclassified Janthinobacterium TaxID=2610881 RepID=UPI000347179E|nr:MULTISPECIES: LytTR family DNA-binding domain-containing protein [unclassified Janthinobacterium]MEC5162635.1 two-component system LytT family response regulator [Janthinobacterium sp. CG_S6]